MSTLNTPQWDTIRGCVRLSLTVTGPNHSLERADSNGLHPVRLETAFPLNQEIIIDDFEAAMTGPVTYSLFSETSSTTHTLQSPGYQLPLVHCVINPIQRYRLENVVTISNDRTWDTAISPIIGSAFPRAIPGKTQAITFAMACLFESHGAAQTFIRSLDGSATYMLRQTEHQGLDAYFTPLSARLSPATTDGKNTVWNVELQCQELAYPSGKLLSSIGRSYGDDLDDAPTYRASILTRPLYQNRQAMTNV